MKKFIAILFLALANYGLQAQTKIEAAALDSLIDELLTENAVLDKIIAQPKDYHMLYWQAAANNRTVFAGREIGDAQPSGSAAMYYFNSWGLSAGISGSWYRDASPQYSTTVASIGYGFSPKFSKKLYLRANYDRYFFSNTDYTPTFNSNISLGASFRHKWFSASADGTMLMGSETGWQANFSTSAKIVLKRWGTYNYLRLRPGIQLYFGQEDVEYANSTDLTGGWANLFDTYYTQREMGLMNVQLRLPIELSVKGFDISAGYYFNIPRSLDPAYSYSTSSYFGVSVGYMLSLGK